MDTSNIKEMSKLVEKYPLKAPITLDELYQLMVQRWTPEMPGKFRLKKGLFGKSIKFDVYMQIRPTVTAKGNTVIIRRTKQSTQVGGVDIRDTKQRIAALKEGGLKSAALGGAEYFVKIRNALREILKDRM
jgi:hypothetical protein